MGCGVHTCGGDQQGYTAVVWCAAAAGRAGRPQGVGRQGGGAGTRRLHSCLSSPPPCNLRHVAAARCLPSPPTPPTTTPPPPHPCSHYDPPGPYTTAGGSWSQYIKKSQCQTSTGDWGCASCSDTTCNTCFAIQVRECKPSDNQSIRRGVGALQPRARPAHSACQRQANFGAPGRFNAVPPRAVLPALQVLTGTLVEVKPSSLQGQPCAEPVLCRVSSGLA